MLLRRPPAASARRRVPRPVLAAAACVGLGVAGLGLALLAQRDRLGASRGDEATILAARSGLLALWRWAADPAVVVLDIPGLPEQGRMLNRVAALVEKQGQPRDRVLGDEELAQAITGSGATAETYYYGHDYDAAAIARFFVLADRDAVRLVAEEERLRGIADRAGWLRPGAVGALLSIPQPGGPVDARMRAVILHHELAHGEFFTRPAYAAWTRRFWRGVMTADERARMSAWLASEGYDPGQEDTMASEAQAYLVWTGDPAFFTPGLVGMDDARAAALRAAFLEGRPPDGRDEAP